MMIITPPVEIHAMTTACSMETLKKNVMISVVIPPPPEDMIKIAMTPALTMETIHKIVNGSAKQYDEIYLSSL